MAIKAGSKNAAGTAECVDVNHTGSETMRVTVRSNAESMSVREADSKALALAAAPDSAIAAHSQLYTQFASNGYTYCTYVIAWTY